MKVLVLGATGWVGARLCALLREAGASVTAAVVHTGPGAAPARSTAGAPLRLDLQDGAALAAALAGHDALVDVLGDGLGSAHGSPSAATPGLPPGWTPALVADRLARAAAACRPAPRWVHLGSAAVYGALEGRIDERMSRPTGRRGDDALRAAEDRIAQHTAGGGGVVLLRPGCIWGPGSQPWVVRIGRWLQAGRLGDLGADGDGWSNLVHVDDVCLAALRALQLPLGPGQVRAFNLAAPDSPRWNEYFMDLALALGATPVRRPPSWQMAWQAHASGPAWRLAQRLAGGAGAATRAGTAPADGAPACGTITPALRALWRRQQRLDAGAATRALRLAWVPYPTALADAAGWLVRQDSLRRLAPALALPAA